MKKTAPLSRRPLARWFFLHGMRAKRVARVLKLNLHTVRDWESEFDLEPQLTRLTMTMNEQRRRALELFRAGHGYRTMARRLGIPLWRAKNFAKSFRRRKESEQ